MPILPSLLPIPRHIEYTGELCKLTGKKLIQIDHSHPQALFFSATLLQSWLRDHAGLSFDLYAGKASGLSNIAITLRVIPGI